MRCHRSWFLGFVRTVALVALPLAAGCAGDGEAAPAAASPPGSTPAANGGARTLDIPDPSNALPPGHPPLAQQADGPMVWDVPPAWVEETPASSMRRAQYRVPGPGGDGELIVFYFGPGQGGDTASNAARWAGQFEQPDGSSSIDRMKTTQLAGSALPVTLVEVTGTYDGGMTMTAAPSESKPDHMLLGGIAEHGDGPWFFKLTGPRATLEAERERFAALMRSVRPAS